MFYEKATTEMPPQISRAGDAWWKVVEGKQKFNNDKNVILKTTVAALSIRAYLVVAKQTY